MDKLDRDMLNLIQKDFPLTARPWAAIGQELGLSEQEVIARVSRLKKDGIIRRIGGVFDSRGLGFYSTLCATRVEEHDLERIAQVINRYPGVTHNYQREGEYNLWFTLTAPSPFQVQKQLEEMEQAIGASIVSLPAQKIFKIEVTFEMSEDSHD